MPNNTSVVKFAVCLFDDVATLDYQGPVELFGFLSKKALTRRNWFSPYEFEFTYLAPSRDPVIPMSGPPAVPHKAYGEVDAGEQFDVLLIPGGLGTRPSHRPESLLEFVRKQTPGAKYVLTVCTGSYILAQAGVFDGRRGTTNKAAFKEIKNDTAGLPVTWVPKARWVVDGKFWTSSGITAGMDMANAFLEFLVGSEITQKIRGIAEFSAKEEGEDEFAEFYGLV
ncbi:Class I glutamine amidotransferase-like protein [Abortiporus biennis]